MEETEKRKGQSGMGVMGNGPGRVAEAKECQPGHEEHQTPCLLVVQCWAVPYTFPESSTAGAFTRPQDTESCNPESGGPPSPPLPPQSLVGDVQLERDVGDQRWLFIFLAPTFF